MHWKMNILVPTVMRPLLLLLRITYHLYYRMKIFLYCHQKHQTWNLKLSWKLCWNLKLTKLQSVETINWHFSINTTVLVKAATDNFEMVKEVIVEELANELDILHDITLLKLLGLFFVDAVINFILKILMHEGTKAKLIYSSSIWDKSFLHNFSFRWVHALLRHKKYLENKPDVYCSSTPEATLEVAPRSLAINKYNKEHLIKTLELIKNFYLPNVDTIKKMVEAATRMDLRYSFTELSRNMTRLYLMY